MTAIFTRIILPLLLAFITPIITLFLISGPQADATGFKPTPPSTILSTTTLSANPDSVTKFDIPSPDANFSAAIGYTDDSFTIKADADITDGRTTGYITSLATLGVANSFCGASALVVSFRMREGDIDTADTISQQGPPTGRGRLSNFVDDDRGDTTEGIYLDIGTTGGTVDSKDILLFGPTGTGSLVAFDTGGADPEMHTDNGNLLYDYGEHIYRDMDESGTKSAGDIHLSGPSSEPANGTALKAFTANEKHLDNLATANDYDGTAGNGLPDHLDAYPIYNNIIFTPSGGGPSVTPLARYSGNTNVAGLDVILQFVVFNAGDLSTLPNGETAIAALGKPSVTVLQDPTSAPSKTISDFCSPLSSTTRLCGKTDTDPDAVGFGDCDTAGGSEAAQLRLISPAAARTTQAALQAVSDRDADNDGIENDLDPCAVTDSSAWNARASGGAADPDIDEISNDCDPTPGATPASNKNSDPDGDIWDARIDNCALVDNGDATMTDSNFPADGDALNDIIEVDTTAGFAVGEQITISQGIALQQETRIILVIYADAPGHAGTEPGFEVADLANSHFFNEAVSNDYLVAVSIGQADQDVAFPADVPDRGPRTDAIGTECEANFSPTLGGGAAGVATNGGSGAPDGHYHRTAVVSRSCITNAPGTDDVDGDGVCNTGAGLIDPDETTACWTVTPNTTPCKLDSDGDNLPGGACGANVGGESSDGTCRPLSTCYDGTDNDSVADNDRPGGVGANPPGLAAGAVDTNDPDCAHVDQVDDCISTANTAPAGFSQPDGDTDGIGDACDSSNSSDADGESDSIEIHVGTGPTLACSATLGADDEFVDARPTDVNDDKSVSGADLSRVAANIGTSVTAGAPQAFGGPVGRLRLRLDIRPLPMGDNAISGADLSGIAGVIGTSC